VLDVLRNRRSVLRPAGLTHLRPSELWERLGRNAKIKYGQEDRKIEGDHLEPKLVHKDDTFEVMPP